MTTPNLQNASPRKGSPRKLEPPDRLQRQIDEGRVSDEPYVPPTSVVDIDTRLPEERAALNLWADEFCTTGKKAYLEQVRLARERAIARETSITNNIVHTYTYSLQVRYQHTHASVPSASGNTNLAQSLAAAERLIQHPQPGQLVPEPESQSQAQN